MFAVRLEYFAANFQNLDFFIPRYLPQDEEEAFRFAGDCFRAEAAALRLISRAEQSSKMLSLKLQKRGFTAPAAKKAVTYLCDTGLVDDYRYATLWLEGALRMKSSTPRKLLAALAARGIDGRTQKEALAETLTPEKQTTLLTRYLKKNPHTQKSVLKAEGFSMEVIAG
jgi:regulatory protein